MDKSKGRRRVPKGKESSPTVESGSGLSTARFPLDQIALKKLVFEEVPFDRPIAPTADGRAKLDLKMAATVTVYPEGVEAYLEVSATPKPAELPVRAVVGMSVYIRRTEGVDDAELVEFARTGGLLILFPYIREVISSTSARGRFPSILLDPVDLLRFIGAADPQPK